MLTKLHSLQFALYAMLFVLIFITGALQMTRKSAALSLPVVLIGLEILLGEGKAILNQNSQTFNFDHLHSFPIFGAPLSLKTIVRKINA